MDSETRNISWNENGQQVLSDERENLNELGFVFSSSAAVVSDNDVRKIKTAHSDNATSFFQNLHYWNSESAFLSTNNFDNSYFRQIVNMGYDAVPFIIEELKKGPTPLVQALVEIFPGIVQYDGFVSLEEACSTWLSILQRSEQN